MKEKKPTLQESAMKYGTIMGIFWTLKFVLFPMGMSNPLLLTLFFFLTLAVPVVGYFLVKKYRDNECEGSIGFPKAILFTIFMYMFASLFATVIHYVYFRYMDNGYIVSSYQNMLNEIGATAITAEMEASVDQLRTVLDSVANMSAIDISLQLISQNIFYCIIVAIPTAIIVKRNPQTA